MRPRATSVFVAFCLLAVPGPRWVSAGEPAIDRTLAQFPGAERGALSPLIDEGLAGALPGYAVYTLRFRQYPVAVRPPARLKASNLLLVGRDDAVTVVVDAPSLEKFFRSAVAPASTEAQARAVAKAWLRLSEELAQDGYLQFSIPEASVAAGPDAGGGRRVTGKAVVVPQAGNHGEIDATLVFDPGGRLVSATETRRIKRGMRPICQATKLLDPDPVVRRMAEQDLLVMGRAAGPYLEEQRAAAPPELRRAIDRVWRRILAEDR